MEQQRKREERLVEWNKELEMTQRLREKKKELYTKARQRVVDQLEKEAHLWLTNEEEVEKALGNPVAGQILWVKPGSIIGAPSGAVSVFLGLFLCLTCDVHVCTLGSLDSFKCLSSFHFNNCLE